MKLTPVKLRYLMTVAELQKELPHGVQCIHVAACLGISRASACRMIGSFREEGWVRREGRKVWLTQEGQDLLKSYETRYQEIYPLFSGRLGLSDYDAQQCTMALVLTLDDYLLEKLYRAVSE
ncbi:MAG: hypothetical protein ACOX60_03580 [Massiliimalia sp.]|jgi:Mn-dependent DtxR family transcriptional regulator